MTGARSLGFGLGLFLTIGAFAPAIAYAAPWYFYNQCTYGGRYDYQIHVSSTTVPTNGIWWISTVDSIEGDQVYGSTPAGAPGPCGYPKYQGTHDVLLSDDLQTHMQDALDGNYVIADNNSKDTDAYGTVPGYGNSGYYFFHKKDGVIYMDGEPLGYGTTTATTTPTGPSSIMFLPGIEASRLYEGDGQLWEPPASAPIGNLALDANGDALGHNIYTKDVIDEAYVSNAGPNIYKSFLSQMNTLSGQGKIAAFEAIPYDWRLSLQDNINYGHEIDGKIYYSGDNRATSTPYLLQEFYHLKDASPAHKVTIVAHSNGGLLLKELLILHPELNQYIDKIIFVDVPQVGTPQALAGLLHGDGQGIPKDWAPLLLSPQSSRSIANNFPSIYNLLPSQNYFTYVDDPVATFDTATLPDYVDRYGEVIHSTARMNAFMNDAYQKVSPDSAETNYPATTNGTMIGSAQDLHMSLDAWEPPSTVELIQIAGWGVPTIKSIDYSLETHCPVVTINGCEPSTAFGYTAPTTIDGDGTVVTPSQLWTSQSLPNVRNYWLNIDAYNYDHKRLLNYLGLANSHKDVLEIPTLLHLLSDEVQNTSTSSSVYEYVSSEAPASANIHRLRYALHSPLSLNLYDSQGRHTGISTTTGEVEEEVPGTYYREFGDVKYIFSETDYPASLIMNGEATSTFTLNVDELQGDAVTASTTFTDIPVTPSTTAMLSTQSNLSTLSSLSVNFGDGVTHAVAPVPNGTATLDLTPPEIALGFSTTTSTLIATCTDDSGTCSVTSTSTASSGRFFSPQITTVTAVDAAGNNTELVYRILGYDSRAGTIMAVPESLSYNGKRTTLKNDSLAYLWARLRSDSYISLVSSITVSGTTTTGIYQPRKDSTLITTRTGFFSRPSVTNIPGLVAPGIVTHTGQIMIGY